MILPLWKLEWFQVNKLHLLFLRVIASESELVYHDKQNVEFNYCDECMNTKFLIYLHHICLPHLPKYFLPSSVPLPFVPTKLRPRPMFVSWRLAVDPTQFGL